MLIKEPSQSEINSVIALFSNGKFQEALDAVVLLTESFPEDSLLHNITGACYSGLGQLDSAVNYYDKAIAIRPDYSKALYNLGAAHHELHQYVDSIKNYEKSLVIDPDYAEAHNNLGNVLRESGQLDEAIKSYKKALIVNPNYFEAYFSLGITFQELEQWNTMIEYLEKAVAIQPDLAEAHNRIGFGLERLGRLNSAIHSYQIALEIKPDFSEAYNNLGNVFKELGQLDEAVESYQKALEINPNISEAYNNLGNTFKALGRHDEAIESYQKALEINPDYPALHNNLGSAYKEIGQLDDALKSYKNALIYNPDYPESHNNLGTTFFELERFNEAFKALKRAIEIEPEYVDAHYNLAITFKSLDQLDDAVKSYKRAIEINPNFAEAHNNLGNVFKDLKQLDDAAKSFKKAIAIRPDYADAHNNLGNVFKDFKQPDNAIKSYKKAIEINPDFAEAHNNFGSVFKDLNQLDNALRCYQKAIQINPSYAEAHNNLGNVFKDLGQLEDALKSYEYAKAIQHDLEYVLGSILSAKMNSCNWEGLSDLLDELINSINNNEKVIDPFTLFSLIDDPALQRKVSEIRIINHQPRNDILPKIDRYSKHKKIRIGYFSADFREHPIGYLTAELYEVHDRNQFEIHAFSFGQDTKDEMNLRIKAGVDSFHDVHSMSDQEVALLARSFEIDIAVDLGGHTAHSRPEVFAMSAAPIQVIYMFLGTMGADYYDYLIAGQSMIPKKNHKHFLEKIVYLPSYLVNDSTELPPKVTLTRKELGLPEEGFVFCCFNNSYKFTPDVFDSWARILQSVGGSVLIIYADDELAKINLSKEIIQRGVDPARLFFSERLKRPEYLARYRVADLFLDTRPFNAGTTASDALRMGLPVLTCTGNSFSSMEASGIIRALNLPELITSSPEEYEALAIELATNPDKLKIIKEKLLDNFSTAPLYDTSLFTKNVESAYTMIYERYLEGLEPDHIYVEE